MSDLKVRPPKRGKLEWHGRSRALPLADLKIGHYNGGMDLGGEVAEEFGLFQDGFGGFFLFVGRVAVFTEDPFDHGAELGFDAFFFGPVDGGVFADGVGEFAGYGL